MLVVEKADMANQKNQKKKAIDLTAELDYIPKPPPPPPPKKKKKGNARTLENLKLSIPVRIVKPCKVKDALRATKLYLPFRRGERSSPTKSN